MQIYTPVYRGQSSEVLQLPRTVIAIGESFIVQLDASDSNKRLYRDRLGQLIEFWERKGNYDLGRFRTYLREFDRKNSV